MQAAMCLTAAPLACRLQRPMSSRVATPAGLAGGLKVLRSRPARRSGVAARAQLEDALVTAVDSAPSAFHSFAAHLSTQLFLLGDAAEAVAGAVGGDAAAQAVADAVSQGGDAAVEAASAAKKGGFFGAFADTFESFLKVLDGGLEKMGVPYSYGFAIILVTIIVKVATYPLTAKQVESTLSMQAMQPRVKELQAKYANDPERLQVETAKLYQGAGVNPLAGCLPSLATIPIFIGLYRALSNVADEGLLTEGFFWIPSLAGPTTVNGGLSWVYAWQDGIPPLGFHDTAAYLVLPILLIISQYISQKVISPPQSQDPAQQQTANILKFLPLMIGYFSLNVPSGLTLYWFANNLITTAQQVYLRNKFAPLKEAGAAAGAGGDASTAIIDVEPVEKRPTGKELNARRSARQLEAPPSSGGSGGGGSRGEKFRAIRAREAAARATQQAGSAAAGGAAAAPQPERGAKFRALKAKEAAAKAAQAGSASGNGSAPAAAAQQEPAAAAVATVVEAEVVGEDEDAQQQQQHEAGSSGAAAGGSKGGKKKGGKRK